MARREEEKDARDIPKCDDETALLVDDGVLASRTEAFLEAEVVVRCGGVNVEMGVFTERNVVRNGS